MRVMVEIGGDIGLAGIIEDAFQLLMSGPFNGAVDLLGRGGALDDDLEIDNRNIGRRHADGDAVEPALELRQNEANGLGGTGRGRDHRQRGGPGPVQILVQRIQRRLVAGIRMHGGHESLVDADRVIDDLGDGGEAIGGAGGVRHHLVLGGELVVIDAEDDGQVGTLGRGRDQDTFGAGGQMSGSLILGGENSGAFKRYVDTQFLPWKGCRILYGGNLDAGVLDDDAVAFDLYLIWKAAMDGIEAQQMRVGLDGAEIVDCDNLDVLAAGFDDRAQNVSADAAETVDCHANSHSHLHAAG